MTVFFLPSPYHKNNNNKQQLPSSMDPGYSNEACAYPFTCGGLNGSCAICFTSLACTLCAVCGQYVCGVNGCVKEHRQGNGILCVQYQLLQAVLNCKLWVGFRFPSYDEFLPRLLTFDESFCCLPEFNYGVYNPVPLTKVFTSKLFAYARRLVHFFKFDVNEVATSYSEGAQSPFNGVFDLGITIFMELGGLPAMIAANQAFVLLLHQIFTERCSKLKLRWQWRFWIQLVDSAWRLIPKWQDHIGCTRWNTSMTLVGAPFKSQKFALGRVQFKVPPESKTSIAFRCEDGSEGLVGDD